MINTLNDEQICIGNWLTGSNLEDLKWLDENDFYEKDIIKLIKMGKNLYEIGKETKRLSEIVTWTEANNDTLYKTALSEKLKSNIYKAISNMNDLKSIKEKIEHYQGVSTGTVEETKDPAKAMYEELEARKNSKTYKYERLPSLNYYTGGIKRKELTTIAARPGVGKSAFSLQIAVGAWEQGAKVLYFPLEMSMVQTYGRIAISKGYATTKEIRTGNFENPDNYNLMLDKIDEMDKSGRFKIFEGENNIERIERAIDQEKPFLVIIDQLTQLRSNNRFGSIREQFTHMTANLKRIALNKDVAIILLCQINRNADNLEPTMSNLKESGSIEEDSDNIILLHNFSPEQITNPESVDWENERPMLCNLAKQRDGEVGKFLMLFRPSRFMFYERQQQR